jgi:hypothetical protein
MLWMISGFHNSLSDIVAVLGYCAAYIGSYRRFGMGPIGYSEMYVRSVTSKKGEYFMLFLVQNRTVGVYTLLCKCFFEHLNIVFQKPKSIIEIEN